MSFEKKEQDKVVSQNHTGKMKVLALQELEQVSGGAASWSTMSGKCDGVAQDEWSTASMECRAG